VSEGDLEARLETLERKVSDLYRRLGEAEPGFEDAAAGAQDPRVIEAIRSGNEIEAIKLYSELTGVGLAEAKEAVDGVARLHRPLG
jgi:ribosomal protein L7/L12